MCGPHVICGCPGALTQRARLPMGRYRRYRQQTQARYLSAPLVQRHVPLTTMSGTGREGTKKCSNESLKDALILCSNT